MKTPVKWKIGTKILESVEKYYFPLFVQYCTSQAVKPG
jgi:hypothetical protein